ncbi:P-loop domain-containing protein, partial [Helicobacter typhlonius]
MAYCVLFSCGVVESIEAGSGLFLIDEDTSATNFMVRDEFMQQV